MTTPTSATTRRRRTAPATCLAALAALGSLGLPAAAAATTAPSFGPAAIVRGADASTSNSINWSGYVAQGGTFTSVSGSWVTPSVICKANAQQSTFWVGLDGWESDSVEQTGTGANCKGTTAIYYAWFEMYPSPYIKIPLPVQPGDAMTGSVTYAGNNKYDLELIDATQGWTKTTTRTVSGDDRLSAEAIAEAPCCTDTGYWPLSHFTAPVAFTNVTTDGEAIGSHNPLQLTMIDNSGDVRAKASALKNGTDFTVTWKKSN